MEKILIFLVMIISSVNSFGQQFEYTLDERALMNRYFAIMAQAFINLGDEDVLQALFEPCEPSIEIRCRLSKKEGLKLVNVRFRHFDKVPDKYKQKDWYNILGLDCKEQIIRNTSANNDKRHASARDSIVGSWFDEIKRITMNHDTIYCIATYEWIRFKKEYVDTHFDNHIVPYTVHPLRSEEFKDVYRNNRLNIKKLQQWINKTFANKPKRVVFQNHEP